MIAAFAFLAVPAALYMSNPEFTCGDIDDPTPIERSASPEEDPQATEVEENKDKKEDNGKSDKKDNKTEVKQEEKKSDQKPKHGGEVPRINGKTEAQKAIDEAKLRREKLLQAANEVLNKQDQPRSAEKPTAKQIESRRASTGSRNFERPTEFTPPAPPVPTPAPASFVRAEKTAKSDGPDAVPVTPTPPVLSAPIIPRTNSAYKMRVEHQQAQQLASQLQAASPLGRPLSPVRTKNEPQQSETVSPRAREDRLSALANSSSANSPATQTTASNSPSNPSSGSSPVPARTSSSANMSSKSGSPVPVVQTLPPLPPRRREDNSPAQLSAPNSAPTPVATPAPAATVVAVVASAVPNAVTASTYLTPREKQQRALAELRRQEEEQRNMAKVMIQEELQRALDELHKQEALQRQHDESERNLVQEEQRRRETVQQAILEEKLRIERDDELQREERRKLKEQQKNIEAQQRQADQRAMAELLLEVEKDRERDEKRALAAQQQSRSQQHLLDEEKILEQLRVQNQYPYPRGHPLSNVPSTSSANSKTTSQSASPVVSPLTSPFVSPHASMRIPRTSTGGPAIISPVASTSRDSLDGKATFSGIPTSTAGSFNGRSPTSGSGPNTGSSEGPYQSPYHSRLNRPASIQTLSPLSGSSNKLPSPAHPVRTSASPAVSPESSPLEVRRAGSSQRFERPGSYESTPNGALNGVASPTKHTAESVNRMIMEQMHSVDEQDFAEHSVEFSTERSVEAASRRSTASASRTSMTSSFRKSQTTTSTSKTTTTSTTSTTAVAAIAAARAPASPSRHSLPSSTVPKLSPQPAQTRQDELPEVEEDAELRVLHAREDLALKIDAYIRTQKKYSSAVPRKHKVSIAKVNTDCDKYRKAYNEHVFEESLKLSSLQNFLQSHPRFNVTGGGQMVGVAYLTPYQASENRRVFGHFRCTKCMKYWMESGVNKSDYREWQNGYSYKDCFQACKQCDVQVYPYHQRFLKKNELNFDDRAKHDVARCSRCETLRKPCYEVDL